MIGTENFIPEVFKNSIILSAKNSDVRVINEKILNMINCDKNALEYCGSDEVLEIDLHQRFPNEFLNSLTRNVAECLHKN